MKHMVCVFALSYVGYGSVFNDGLNAPIIRHTRDA